FQSSICAYGLPSRDRFRSKFTHSPSCCCSQSIRSRTLIEPFAITKSGAFSCGSLKKRPFISFDVISILLYGSLGAFVGTLQRTTNLAIQPGPQCHLFLCGEHLLGQVAVRVIRFLVRGLVALEELPNRGGDLHQELAGF